ncbi:hypothetical protein FRC07_009517 [Ceratobasidium sp. 392]|nr:hypothetical protein FRC07_009517 [Ceratobasidium sp. 392]
MFRVSNTHFVRLSSPWVENRQKVLRERKFLLMDCRSKSDEPSDSESSPDPETALSASLAEIHLSLPIDDALDDPGIDPEDLPLEDPDPEVVDEDPEAQIGDYWDINPPPFDMAGPSAENKDCAIRCDNQPIPRDEETEMIKQLDEIVKKSFKGHGKTRHSTFDELTLERIRLMLASLRLEIKLKNGLMAASELAAAAIGRTEWAARKA